MGRYMLSDRSEYRCTLIDVALGGIALSGPEAGSVGEPVVVYIDKLGRVQGNIVRYVDGGFAIALTSSDAAANKLAERLDRLKILDDEDGKDRRGDVRVPSSDLASTSVLHLGSSCEIIDLSILGAEIKVDGQPPPIGAVLRLGKLSCRVVRHSGNGVGVEFVNPPMGETLAGRWTQISSPAGDDASAA